MVKNKKKLPKKYLTQPYTILPEWMANPYYSQTSHVTSGVTGAYGSLVRILSSSMVEVLIGDFIPAVLMSMGKSIIVRSKEKPPQALNIYQKGMEHKWTFQMTSGSASGISKGTNKSFFNLLEKPLHF